MKLKEISHIMNWTTGGFIILLIVVMVIMTLIISWHYTKGTSYELINLDEGVKKLKLIRVILYSILVAIIIPLAITSIVIMSKLL